MSRRARLWVVLLVVVLAGGAAVAWAVGYGVEGPKTPMTLEELPPGMLDTARATLPDVHFTTAWKLSDGRIEVRGKNKKGKIREVEFDTAGKVVEVE
jgi:hypothetical protein